jgi:valyl-tRNA synthetase
MVAAWPSAEARWEDDEAEARVAELQEVIATVRNLRAEYGVQPGAKVRLRVTQESGALHELLSDSGRILQDLARVDEVGTGPVVGEIGASAVLRSGAQLFVPLEGVIDLQKERARLRAELERAEGLAASARKRLDNESFVARAPADVVMREREKLGSVEEQREKLARTLRSLESTG